MTKVGFPTDEHYPFNDGRAVALAQRIIHDFKPDILIRGSDALDFYRISSYMKSREVYAKTLMDEINAWKAAEKAWGDTVPKSTKKYFLIGNHEDRLRRYILAQAPELEGLPALELQNLLDFKEFSIRLAYNNEVVVDGMLLIKHGEMIRKHSAYTAKAELENEKYGITIWTGHTHRMGSHWATTRRGPVAAYECGCLCDQNPSYMSKPNWQLGLTVGETQPAGVVTEQIPFYEKSGKYYAYWRGKEYSE
jgi:hypothetical protein